MSIQELIPTDIEYRVGSDDPSTPAVIEVSRLHKVYGATVAVDDVSFAVHAGEIFGILGRNGAGKTTTVECITGLRTPDGARSACSGSTPAGTVGSFTSGSGCSFRKAPCRT